jgi:cobalt-zinc-cadmium efflux system protein
MHNHDHAHHHVHPEPGVGAGSSSAQRHRRRLAIVLTVTLAYTLVEGAGAFFTNSLALLADAAHMLADSFGLGMALFAIWLGQRPATPQRTYGYYRTEILAALVNTLVLFGICGYILVEAWQRFITPQEVAGPGMMAVAALGMLVNLVGVWLLHPGAQESLNVRGAFLEVLADLLGSAAVLIAGVIILVTGWYPIDPLFSILIGFWVVPRAWKLLAETVAILLEGTPTHLNLSEVRAAMEAVPEVDSIHDLHVWSITSGYVTLSAHARVNDDADRMQTLRALCAVLQDRFDIEHTTIQLEDPSYRESPRHA